MIYYITEDVFQTSLKRFEREKRPLPYQKSSTYSAILFVSVQSTEKGLRVFYDPNRNFRFPFLKRETPAMYRKRPAAGNSEHQTLLSTSLAV